jgi:hypothetical protein
MALYRARNEAGINTDVDQRPSDFYAFGKIVWALLAGRPPLPREQITEPEQRLSQTLAEPELRALDALVADLVRRDARARLADWPAVIVELLGARRRLSDDAGDAVQPPRRDLAALARRVRHSSPVELSVTRVDESARRDAWFKELREVMHERAHLLDPVLTPLAAEFGDMLSIVAASGTPPSVEELVSSGVSLPGDVLRDPGGFSSGGAGSPVFMIHSPRGLAAFPSFILRVWLWATTDTVRLLQVPTVTPHGKRQFVPAWLEEPLVRASKTLPALRHTTIDEAAAFVDEAARQFLAAVESYLEIVDEGQDPAAQGSWRGRRLGAA